MILFFTVLVYFTLYIIPRKNHFKQEEQVLLSVAFSLMYVMYEMRDITVGADTKSNNNCLILFQNNSLKDLTLGKVWFQRPVLMCNNRYSPVKRSQRLFSETYRYSYEGYMAREWRVAV